MRARGGGLALVTGASGGIGEHLAHAFARAGSDVVLVARSADRLATVARAIADAHGVSATTHALDLGAREAPAELCAALREGGRPVRHLVNNAGFGLSGRFAEHALEDELGLIDLNIRALTELTHRLVPEIVAEKGGILNVASVAAYLPGPLMASYYASKAYVLAFSEALAQELAPDGVTVTALCPGPTATGFQARAGLRRAPGFAWAPQLSAREVAELGHAAYRSGRAVCVPGLSNQLAARLARLAPRAATAGLAARMNRRRR